MASTDLTFTKQQPRGGQGASEEDNLHPDCKELILSLPKEKGWVFPYCYLFQGFWCASSVIPAINNFQKHFQAKDSDIVIATLPKSGTTWLKALTFAIVNRHRFSSFENHPLLISNSHELVPFLEWHIYSDILDQSSHIHLSNMIEPRLFGTHIPFPSLSKSIKETDCRIIYICRNPFDTFVSTWIFYNKIKPESLPTLSLEEAFEKYCQGMIPYGPFWSHILGYFKESIATPNKVLFLKYEDLKEDVNFNVKRIGEFLGFPFTQEEENSEVLENIIKICSFEKMKKLEANKSGTIGRTLEKKHFFRKAEIGDWKNYFSSSMTEKLSKIIEEKLSESGLSFQVCS